MIGGTDIIIPAASLEHCARVVAEHWPHARFEDAVTGEKYATSAEIPFERVHELFAYRDAQAERAWDADSPDSPANSMIYLILLPPSVTVVLDDPVHPEIQAILDSMRDPLRVGSGNGSLPNRFSASE